MKREIKFRAWVNGSGDPRMIEWDDIDAFEICNDKLWHHSGKYTLLGNLILMQYMGFKDEKGIDVYEGDILYERYEDKAEPDGYGETIIEVAFKESAFGWIGDITKEFHPFISHPLDGMVVIGNIYQNPELLNPHP